MLDLTQELVDQRVRKKGGGRKKKIITDLYLKHDIEQIVESSTIGDPVSPLLWCFKKHA